MAKLAVQLPKKKRTHYRFQKLKMCTNCQRYSVIKEESCPDCGLSYTGVEVLVKQIFKKRLFSETISILILVCIGIVAAPTITDLYSALTIGLLFSLAYVILTLLFIKTEYYSQFKKLLFSDLHRIKAGIQNDSDRAKEDVKAGNVAGAYDKLREIGDFIDNDQLKIRSVMALNEIALRKDMELEIEPLIPSSYDKDFVKYALEVVKINRTLVTKKVIAYFVTFQNEVAADFGVDSLIQVAGSALRMKLYIHEFADFIQQFLDYFPRERVLRLCSILHAHPEENWGKLRERTKQLVQLKYHYDPDFKPYV